MKSRKRILKRYFPSIILFLELGGLNYVPNIWAKDSHLPLDMSQNVHISYMFIDVYITAEDVEISDSSGSYYNFQSLFLEAKEFRK
jgi:hypothetical protein